MNAVRRHRDRHGRGLRGTLAPQGVPLHRTRSDAFDDEVLDAVEHLDSHWPGDLDGVEFAVDDVPAESPASYDSDVVADRGVALGQLLRPGQTAPPTIGIHTQTVSRPTILLYRRPIEARSEPGDERASLLFAVVAELVGQLLGRDPGDIHSD